MITLKVRAFTTRHPRKLKILAHSTHLIRNLLNILLPRIIHCRSIIYNKNIIDDTDHCVGRILLCFCASDFVVNSITVQFNY